MAAKSKPTPNRTSEFLRLSRQLRAKVDSMLKCAADLEADGDPISAGAAIANESKEWAHSAKVITSTLGQLQSAAEVRRQSAAEELADQLRRSLTTQGLVVHGEGNSLFVNGIVHIELEPDAGRAKINGVVQTALSTQALTDAAKADATILASQSTTPATFLGQLAAAYRHALLPAEGSFGTPVMTTDLLPWLLFQRQTPRFLLDPQLGGFVAYPFPLFRADLFGLLNSSVQSIGDITFRWSSGSTTKGAVFMLVPSLGRPAHVGRIWFERKVGGQ